MTTPTLYVTNWASPKLHGPGRKWTIMAAPRHWERGEGCVIDLTPTLDSLRRLRAGELTMTQYRDRFVEAFLCRGRSMLEAVPIWDHETELGSGRVLLESGDTVCCACSRAAAMRGECHRVWAAELMRRVGCRVILDGRELVGVTEDWAPMFDGEAVPT